MKAVILILKHATILRLSDLNVSLKSALILAELDYQEANVDLKVQQHLLESAQEQAQVEQFVAFIMATDISLFILASASVKIISHYMCAEATHSDHHDLALSQSSVEANVLRKAQWLKQLLKPLRKTKGKDK